MQPLEQCEFNTHDPIIVTRPKMGFERRLEGKTFGLRGCESKLTLV